MKIRELEQESDAEKAKNKELKIKLNASQAKLNVERCIKIQAKEFSDAQKL